MGEKLSHPQFVMAGLDPAIHSAGLGPYRDASEMDPGIKSRGEGG